MTNPWTKDLWFLIVIDRHRLSSIVNACHLLKLSIFWKVKSKMLIMRRNTLKCNYMTVTYVNNNFFIFWASNHSSTPTAKEGLCTWLIVKITWHMFPRLFIYLSHQTCVQPGAELQHWSKIDWKQSAWQQMKVNNNVRMAINSNLRTQACDYQLTDLCRILGCFLILLGRVRIVAYEL